MKAALFLLTFYLISVFPASASENSHTGETSTVHIADLYSDLKSFDVTLYSDQPENNLSLEVLLVRPVGTKEKTLDRQVFSVDSIPANKQVMKVGFWNIGSSERGAYKIKARLLEGNKDLSEAEYNFAYGTNSASRIQVNDLVANSQGISVALSPKEASLFDIEYMLVNGSDVVYTTKAEKLSLTSIPDIFSAPWGTLLENNKEYTGRIKVQVYSPEKEVISSAERFTARDDAEITDIYKDETGASATVYGRSQVPFEGSLVFSVYKLNSNSEKGNTNLIESVQQKVPVLLNNDDETVEVAWNHRLLEGIYRLEIELLGNDGDIIEHRETVIESEISQNSSISLVNNTTSETEASSENGIPGFSAAALVSGLAAIYILFRNKI
ncbi:hypothetical protein MSBRW_1291 [Methanosarcina barkeri str. Wiesmoor]|uniref:Uncharacterized protein n=2 Tax=Methanosarcina barkeri TaxID=2208 RepID=A0A0E3QKB3_METBA|nr:hypothetical protein [Methanosarcina barkeri]AKB50544.1 hypothetical protein MSBRW_1291 [Methanosarcina barkeri str. Wiesmoor]